MSPLALLSFLAIISSISATTAAGGSPMCQPTFSYFCTIPNFSTVQPFTNTLGHKFIEDARAALSKYGALAKLCPRANLFFCSLYFPVCLNNTNETLILTPCRDICEEAQLECGPHIKSFNKTWPNEWDCNKFTYYRDNQLCFINNQKEASHVATDYSPSNKIHRNLTDYMGDGMAYPSTGISDTTATIDSNFTASLDDTCDAGLFNCLFSDPKRPVCIEKQFVCDGKIDCKLSDDSYKEANEGLDERDCPDYCAFESLRCDNKCVSKNDICNGQVDCSSGEDELNCTYYKVATTQWILLVVTILIFAYIGLRKCCWPKSDLDDKRVPQYESPYDLYQQGSQPTLQIDAKEALITHEPFRALPPKPTSIQSPPSPQPLILTHGHPALHNADSMYQAPSILTRSDAYDTARLHGDSGASSVYGYGHLQPNPKRASTPPPAPPSTPIPKGFKPDTISIDDPQISPTYIMESDSFDTTMMATTTSGYHEYPLYVNGIGPVHYYGPSGHMTAVDARSLNGRDHLDQDAGGCFARSATLPHNHPAHHYMTHARHDDGWTTPTNLHTTGVYPTFYDDN